MGIKGLLPNIEHAKVPIKLTQLKGKRIAIDGHCWLHNGLSCCAFELETGVPTEKYVTAFKNKIIQLLDCGAKPVVVFDGKGLPLKANTARQREKRRKEAREKGFQYLSKGKRSEAYEEFKRSAKITPIMINNVIKMLDGFKVEHMIAPYEADPQLAHLCRSGYVNAVLTTDSDLLVFECPHIIFQRSNFDNLVYIQHASLFTEIPNKTGLLDLTSFTSTMLRHLCILSGCDYVENMPRFGIKTAHKYIKNGHTIEQIVKSHLGTRKMEEVLAYLNRFKIADAGFLYQIVYDPQSNSCIRLNTLLDKTLLTADELGLLGVIPKTKGRIVVDLQQQKEEEENKKAQEPAVVPDTKEPISIVDLTNEEEEEEEICPSLSTTKDDEEEEEEILCTPVEAKGSNKLASKLPDMKNKKTPLQDTTNNKMSAQELSFVFKQKNTSSLIRQKSVFGVSKKSKVIKTHQTTVKDYFNQYQQEKKRKLEIKENGNSDTTLYNTRIDVFSTNKFHKKSKQ